MGLAKANMVTSILGLIFAAAKLAGVIWPEAYVATEVIEGLAGGGGLVAALDARNVKATAVKDK